MKPRVVPALVLSLVAMPIVAIVILTVRGSFKVNDLKVIGEVTPFQFTERSGKLVDLETLKGKVWVASFVFSSCKSQCPMILMEAQKISKALLFKENFRMVSVTIDPMTDTPQRLKQLAEEWKADPFKWLFLTGSLSETKQFMTQGLKLPTEVEGVELMHSSKLVLVDHLSRIRGYYDAEDSQQMRRLLKDAKTLIKKSF